MTRRQFLLAAVAGLFGAQAIRGLLPLSSSSPAGHTPPGAFFSDIEAAKAVGRRYLAQFPDEANVVRLLDDPALRALRYPPAMIPQAVLKKTLREQRSEAFRKGDIVILDGWVLARCEARLCALVALS